VYRLLADYYAPKVPEIARLIDTFREQYGAVHPWLKSSESLVASAAAGSTTPGGLWTPDAPSPSPGSGKLWLPGQE
jgi:hypothetical protein